MGGGEHFGLSAAQTVRWGGGNSLNWGRQDGLAQTVPPQTVKASLYCPWGQYGLAHTVQGGQPGQGTVWAGTPAPSVQQHENSTKQ